MEIKLNSESKIAAILEKAVSNKASDVHIISGLPVMYRIAGDLVPLDDNNISPTIAKELCYSLLTKDQESSLEEMRDIDLIKTIKKHRLRINLSFNKGSVGAVIRILNYSPMSLESLQLPEIVTKMCDRTKGLVLITGTTSQGKTTTLSAMVDYINKNSNKHIVTIEDPIEYIHENKKSVIRQREVGTDTLNFTNGLKAALRQDPDVIVIGEMRDFDSIHIALTAAETGILVLSTLHAMSIDKILERIFSYVPSGQEDKIRLMLSEVLLCVIHQELLPTLSNGKRVACEIMINTPAIRNLIRKKETYHIKSFILTNEKREEMRTMRRSLDELLASGEISEELYDKVLSNYPS